MEQQSTFAQFLDEGNEKAKSDLFKVIKSKQYFFIVGAGCSATVGYPTWPVLLTELEKELTEEERKSLDVLKPLLRAERLELLLNMRYPNLFRDQLSKIFDDKHEPGDLHRQLVSLECHGLLTTNYDTLLERALDEIKGPINHELIKCRALEVEEDKCQHLPHFIFNSNEDPRCVFHLHGTFMHPNKCVITRQNYYDAYGFVAPGLEGELEGPREFELWPLRRKFLWALAATHRLIFIGFSFSDPYFGHILWATSSDMWFAGRIIHFIVIGISKNNIGQIPQFHKFCIARGIQPVYYYEEPETHEGLPAAISEMTGIEKYKAGGKEPQKGKSNTVALKKAISMDEPFKPKP